MQRNFLGKCKTFIIFNCLELQQQWNVSHSRNVLGGGIGDLYRNYNAETLFKKPLNVALKRRKIHQFSFENVSIF